MLAAESPVLFVRKIAHNSAQRSMKIGQNASAPSPQCTPFIDSNINPWNISHLREIKMFFCKEMFANGKDI